jgi:hypothetical protein
MIRCLPLIALLLGACSAFTFGTSTTQRPAVQNPAIGPDGAFWDAATVAEKGDRDAFLYLLSPQMVHRALFPETALSPVETQEEFTRQRQEIETALEPFESAVDSFTVRYMSELAQLLRDRFIEVSEPVYLIRYTGVGGRAEGPNTATVVVSIYPKGAVGADATPESLTVHFIQDGRRWLIHAIDPDPLKGAFVR